MMKLMAKWTLAVLMILGALFAPLSVSPVSASEPGIETNGDVFPLELLSPAKPAETPRYDRLLDLPVGGETFIDGDNTRVNMTYNGWVRATRYASESTKLVDTKGYATSDGWRIKVLRTGETTCKVDITDSDYLWTSVEVFEGTGELRPLWEEPAKNDSTTYWRVEEVIHREPEHPVFWIPKDQIPLSRRGTPLWRYETGWECYAPQNSIHANKNGLGWMDGTTVCRDKPFVGRAGLPALRIKVLNECNVSIVADVAEVVTQRLSNWESWYIGKWRRPAPAPFHGECVERLRIWQIRPPAQVINSTILNVREGGR